MFEGKNHLFFVLISVLVLAIGLTACKPSEPDISVQDAWGRPSPMVATTGAFYMNIVNKGGADRLVSASSEACGVVELHESTMDANGVMSMHPLENGIEIPADTTVKLEPGGMHVMCIDKKEDFATGAELTLVLEFEKSGSVILGVKIQEP